MSEEFANAKKFFLDGYEKGMNQGYLNALHDVEVNINLISLSCENINMRHLNEILDKLKLKIKK